MLGGCVVRRAVACVALVAVVGCAGRRVTTLRASAAPDAVAFTDVAGVRGAAAIVALARLGVLERTTGAFRPTDPIARREFARWLFKTNNALWADRPTKLVRFAPRAGRAGFDDLPQTDPDFPFVQGLADAGFAVGVARRSFRPDDLLTREAMIALKTSVDRGRIARCGACSLPAWRDRDTIGGAYRAAIAADLAPPYVLGNVARAFGPLASFRPRRPVTRAEAALVLGAIGPHATAIASGDVRTVTAAVP